MGCLRDTTPDLVGSGEPGTTWRAVKGWTTWEVAKLTLEGMPAGVPGAMYAMTSWDEAKLPPSRLGL